MLPLDVLYRASMFMIYWKGLSAPRHSFAHWGGHRVLSITLSHSHFFFSFFTCRDSARCRQEANDCSNEVSWDPCWQWPLSMSQGPESTSEITAISPINTMSFLPALKRITTSSTLLLMTPDFSDYGNNSDSWSPIVDFIDDHMHDLGAATPA